MTGVAANRVDVHNSLHPPTHLATSKIKMQHLPPSADLGWAVTASQIIDAPVDKVWDVLLDFSSYAEWNPFVRKQVVLDGSSSKPLQSQVAVPGAILDLTTHIPPTMSDNVSSRNTRVIVLHVDHENHRVSWAFHSPLLPGWLLRSVRWQSLEVLADGKTKYESIEVFNGLLVFFMKLFIGGDLKKSFNAMADGLKARSEQT